MHRQRTQTRHTGREPTASRKSNPVDKQPSGEVTPDASFVNSIVSLKTRLLTPFMKYDKTLKQVVINPEHDRVFRSEVSRVQGVVLRELRRVLEFDSRLTPKEALYLVQKSVMLAFASCAVENDDEVLSPCGSDEEAETFMPRLERIFASRNACGKAVVSLIAALCTGVVRDNYGVVCQRLESRLAAEETPKANARRTDVELQALAATKKNTQDFLQLRAALVTAFDSISAPLTGNGGNSLPRESTAADGATVNLAVQSFYSLLGWMLMVQPDRLNLETSRVTLTASVPLQDSNEPPVSVTYYDPPSGKITIERAAASYKWGVVINTDSKLIGVENALRTATSTGGDLYHALQLRQDGLPIYRINGVTIRDADTEEADGEVGEDVQMSRLGKLQDILKSKVTKVSLLVAGVSGLHDPQEVSFNIIPQGGEGASGQEACLILKRPTLSVDWRLKLVTNSDNQLLVESVSPDLALSGAASEFMNTHLGNLFVAQVNGCEPKDNPFFDDVMRSSLFLVLRLQAVASVNSGTGGTEGVQGSEGSREAATVGTPHHVDPVSEAVAKEDVVPSRAEEQRDKDDHRDVQQRHNFESEELTHEGQGALQAQEGETQREDSGQIEPRKRGRPRKAVHSSASDGVGELEPRKALGAETGGVQQPKAADAEGSTEAPRETEETTADRTEKSEKTREGTRTKKTDKKKAKKDSRDKQSKKQAKAAKKGGKQKKKKNVKAKKGKDKAASRERHAKEKKDEGVRGVESRDDSAQEGDSKGGKKATNDTGATLKEIAEAQGVVDKPLVEVKPRSDVAVIVTRKGEGRRQSSGPAAGSVGEESPPAGSPGIVEITPEVVAQLKDAPPLTFENAVTLDRFDGTNMELRRPDLKTSWDISMTHGGDKLVLTRLPPISTALKGHPFMKTLYPDEAGHISWQVDWVNGIDLNNATRSMRIQAMDAIKKSSKVSFILRQLAK